MHIVHTIADLRRVLQPASLRAFVATMGNLHPGHLDLMQMARAQASQPGAMISFYIKGDINMAERFLRAVKLFTLAESLGGVESLIENPALMTHFSVPPEQRKLLGIEDNFIRISVGIEDCNDLIEDIKQAL